MEYSVIIPYQHLPERESLLYRCIESLVLSSNGQLEICIHEVGEEPKLNLPSKYKYLFTEYQGVFHRAWAINRGVKKLATKEMLILMDGDLIVTPEWYQEVIECDCPSVGWGRINSLDAHGEIEKSKTPSKGSAAGGITIIPHQLFLDLSGIPEDFIGSWGGEDNAFWSKLTSLGYPFRSLSSTITHLYHPKTTPRIRKIQKKALPMFYWNSGQWKDHVEASTETFGSRIPSDKTISNDFVSEKSDAKLTIAMLSWIRPDKLIKTLTKLDETLTIPINLVLMVQGSEILSNGQKRVIKELASRFYRKDVFFTQGNIGTGPARHHLQKRALTRFSVPYFNFGDDDTYYTSGSVEAAIRLMDNDRSIGVVSIRYKPKVYRLDNQLCPRVLSPVAATSSVEYVDSTGSASAIIRREVFDLCSVDPEYKLGQWDLDFFLQARSVGWKVVNYKSFSGMRAINDFGGSAEYRAGRMNRGKINESIKRFKQKWGLLKAV